LWPFHAPDNQVSWLQSGDGLSFGSYGMVMSSGILKTAPSAADPSCSIEMWVRPALFHSHRTILTFYTPENPRQFSLSKWASGLVLRREVGNRHERRVSEAFLPDAFPAAQPVFITLTSDGRHSAVYLNGVDVQSNRDFAFSAQDLTGQLVLGSSPVSSDGWHGQLFGLAVYRRNLAPAEVVRDYQSWINGRRPEVAGKESSVAFYRFDEHKGTIVHNLAGGPDLYIPRQFVVLRQPMLQSPWTQFKWTRDYWFDVLVNFAGFVPFGFFVFAYWSGRHAPGPRLITVLLGAATSFAIEFLQAYLPTRDSGLTDVLTNALGTCAGVVLYGVVRDRLALLSRPSLLNLDSADGKSSFCSATERELETDSPAGISTHELDKAQALPGADVRARVWKRRVLGGIKSSIAARILAATDAPVPPN
jgi:hypothetical protein